MSPRSDFAPQLQFTLNAEKNITILPTQFPPLLLFQAGRGDRQKTDGGRKSFLAFSLLASPGSLSLRLLGLGGRARPVPAERRTCGCLSLPMAAPRFPARPRRSRLGPGGLLPPRTPRLGSPGKVPAARRLRAAGEARAVAMLRDRSPGTASPWPAEQRSVRACMVCVWRRGGGSCVQGVGESSAMGAGARVQRDPLPACVRGTAAAGQGSAGRLLHAAEPAGFRRAGLALAPRGRGCSLRRAPGCPRRPLRARSRRSADLAGRAAERSPAEPRRTREPR